MTVGTTINITKLLTDGVATEFPFYFCVFEQSHLQITLRDLEGEVVKTYAQNEFSVSGLGANAGTVTIVPAPEDGHELIILREVPVTQDTDIVNQGGFYPEVIEKQLDLIVMQVQQVREKLNRAIVSQVGDAVYSFGRLNDGDVVQLLDGVLRGISTAEFFEPAKQAAIVAQAVAGPIYANIELGLAATVDGEGFTVENINPKLGDVYINLSGTAVFIRVIILDPSDNSAASYIGTTSGDSVQEVLDSLGGGSLIDLETGVTGTLPLAQGGTGGTTSEEARDELEAAKRGANEDITSLRQSTAIASVGAATASTIGFRGMPVVASTGSLITFGVDDSGKLRLNTAGGWAIPSNAALALPIGTVLSGYNDSGSTQTLSITSDTLRWLGTTSAGTRTVAARGGFSATKIKATEWVVDGNLS